MSSSLFNSPSKKGIDVDSSSFGTPLVDKPDKSEDLNFFYF